MSALKALFAILIIAIIILVFFNINVLHNKWLVLGLTALIVMLLALAFFEMIGKIISIVISIAAFLLILFLLLVFLKMAGV